MWVIYWNQVYDISLKAKKDNCEDLASALFKGHKWMESLALYSC